MNKEYSNIGGEWILEKKSNAESVAALGSLMGGLGNQQFSNFVALAQTGDSKQLKNSIRSSMNTQLLDENFNPTNVDMTDILADTAKTTLSSFPTSHPMDGGESGLSAVSTINSRESFAGTPEQAFGTETVGNWASLAFAGADPGGE